MNPKVSIIILNWNGLKDTIECLESVRKINYPNYEVIVVDNGSTDSSLAIIKRLFPDITLIKNDKNLGYAEGNNVGIRRALKQGVDYIFLLNNDTIVDPQILNKFIEAANTYPEAGIFGAKIYYYSEPNRIWFAGGFWDSQRLNFIHDGINELDINGKYNAIREIDYACGCALFARREVFQKIGLFDPRFFLTFEENDWCHRARRVEYKSLLVPKAKICHKVSTSFGGNNSPLYKYFFSRNMLLWAEKNLSFASRWHIYLNALKGFFYCVFTLNNFPLVKRLYWDILEFSRNDIVKAEMIGLRDFVFKRFGDCPAYIHKINKHFQDERRYLKYENTNYRL